LVVVAEALTQIEALLLVALQVVVLVESMLMVQMELPTLVVAVVQVLQILELQLAQAVLVARATAELLTGHKENKNYGTTLRIS
jgi:hypothetical protein